MNTGQTTLAVPCAIGLTAGGGEGWKSTTSRVALAANTFHSIYWYFVHGAIPAYTNLLPTIQTFPEGLC